MGFELVSPLPEKKMVTVGATTTEPRILIRVVSISRNLFTLFCFYTPSLLLNSSCKPSPLSPLGPIKNPYIEPHTSCECRVTRNLPRPWEPTPYCFAFHRVRTQNFFSSSCFPAWLCPWKIETWKLFMFI